MVKRAIGPVAWLAAAALMTSGCLPSEGPCEGGGERVNGACKCPKGTTQKGSRCVEVGAHAGMEDSPPDASTGGEESDSAADSGREEVVGEDASATEAGTSECPGGAVATCGVGAVGCISTPGGHRCTCGRAAVNGGTYATDADGRGCHLRAWGLPVPIKTNANAADTLALAADGQDTIVAAWTQRDGPGNDNIWTARFKPAEGWGAPEPLEQGLNDSDSPVLAANASGDVVAAWLELQPDGSGESRYNPQVRYRARSGEWGGVQSVVSDLTGTTRFTRLISAAIDSRGSAFVVWTQWRELWVSQCAQNGACTTGTALSTDPELLEDTTPYALAATDGFAAVLWRTAVMPQGMMLSTYTAAGNWSTPIKVPLSETAMATTINGIALSLDAAGDANVVWQQGPQMWSSRLVRSTNVWGDHDFHGSDALLALASDGGPNVVALTNRTDTSGDGAQGLRAMRYRTGSDTWDFPTQLPIVEPLACTAAVNRSGNAVAVCRVSEGGSDVLRVASSASGGTWSEPTPLMTSGTPYEFKAAIDEAGNATVIWEQGADVWAARLE